jgi:peptide-methionine (S)-S-oxide reductase
MKSTTEAGLDAAAPAPVPADPFLHRERATFAAGCFWGVQAAFKQVPGVLATTAGYTGGRHENPTYEDVASGLTGHAEAVEVVYDPSQVTYDRLLEVFWNCHDPTEVNRQGPDVGSQYRSAIFFHNAEQEQMAVATRQQIETSGRCGRPVATEILPATTFYKAEDRHQDYYEKSGRPVGSR